MALFPPGMFAVLWNAQGSPTPLILCDIGCNEGDLSIQIYNRAKEELPTVDIHLLGIDIDEDLIQKAQLKYGQHPNCVFMAKDVLTQDCITTMQQYLSVLGTPTFHFISLFSITMWLHVHCGDEVFYGFLTKIASMCQSLLIEPQPWRCYRTAKKRLVKNSVALPRYLRREEALQSTDTARDMIDYIVRQGIKSEVYWHLGEEEWGRPIVIFHQESNEHVLAFVASSCTTSAEVEVS